MKREPHRIQTQTPLASDFSDVRLPELPSLPGMTSEAECRYLYWLASTQFEGAGAAIEIGSWLGRSTVHLAAGLRDAGHPATLHCIDSFTWSTRQSSKDALPLSRGQTFQPYFEQNVAPFRNRIKVHRTTIADLTWDGGAIELLFLDAPKTLPDIVKTFEVLGPHLTPGRSLIACQDYLYYPAYALAAVLYTLGGRIELVHVVLGGSTVAFRVREAIDLVRDRPSNWDLRRWSRTEVEASWRDILARLPAAARERLEAAPALHLHDIGERAAAVEAIRALPMTRFQSNKLRGLARSHHYLSYPALYDAAGFPGSLKQKALVPVKRLRDLVRRVSETR